MLYMGSHRQTGAHALLAAFSSDGVHFEPMDTGDTGEDKLSVNQVFTLEEGSEPAAAVCDPFAPAAERYKMILTVFDRPQLRVLGCLLTSSDLIRWHGTGRPLPGWKTEPVTSIFRNEKSNCYTVTYRRTWGDRCVGYTDTNDFSDFSAFQMCMNQDALDTSLDEVYGMPALPYKGAYIGFPVIYTNNAPSRTTKFDPGNIYPQLAFSEDGHYWQRSLRRSFLPEYRGQDGMYWLTAFHIAEDKSVLLYCAHTFRAHGIAFASHDSGSVNILRLREDGFWALRARSGETAVVTTREFCFQGGDIRINIKAGHATCAVLSTDEQDRAEYGGMVVPGFDHSDCVPFSGDSTAWTPAFSGGSLRRFEGKTIVIEVRYTEGSLYSISGNMIRLMNTEASAYRLTGRLPEE